MAQRSIFVSGGVAGIGRAVAERFHAAGWFVGVYDIDVDGALATRVMLGTERLAAGALDVVDPEAWQRALAEFVRVAGRLDVLFNNAGVLATGAFETIPLATHARTIDVNLKGVVNGAYAAFPYLQQTPGARMINMASASAIYGGPDLAVYSATKFAVRGLTEALEIEWREHDIRVSAIWPLFVDTAMVRNNPRIATMSILGIRLKATDVAKVVERAATSKRRRTHWIVGTQTKLTAISSKLGPQSAARAVVAKLSGR